MKIATIAAMMLLSGCGTNIAIEFPTLPDLDEEIRKPCAAQLLTGGFGDLIAKDIAISYELARCERRRANAVSAYETAQRKLKEASDKASADK